MAKYIVKSPLLHNNKAYGIGDEITDLDGLKVEHQIKNGVIEEVGGKKKADDPPVLPTNDWPEDVAALGIEDKFKDILTEAGYETFEEIHEAGVDKLCELKGIGKKSAEAIIAECEE